MITNECAFCHQPIQSGYLCPSCETEAESHIDAINEWIAYWKARSKQKPTLSTDANNLPAWMAEMLRLEHERRNAERTEYRNEENMVLQDTDEGLSDMQEYLEETVAIPDDKRPIGTYDNFIDSIDILNRLTAEQLAQFTIPERNAIMTWRMYEYKVSYGDNDDDSLHQPHRALEVQTNAYNDMMRLIDYKPVGKSRYKAIRDKARQKLKAMGKPR